MRHSRSMFWAALVLVLGTVGPVFGASSAIKKELKDLMGSILTVTAKRPIGELGQSKRIIGVIKDSPTAQRGLLKMLKLSKNLKREDGSTVFLGNLMVALDRVRKGTGEDGFKQFLDSFDSLATWAKRNNALGELETNLKALCGNFKQAGIQRGRCFEIYMYGRRLAANLLGEIQPKPFFRDIKQSGTEAVQEELKFWLKTGVKDGERKLRAQVRVVFKNVNNPADLPKVIWTFNNRLEPQWKKAILDEGARALQAVYKKVGTKKTLQETRTEIKNWFVIPSPEQWGSNW